MMFTLSSKFGAKFNMNKSSSAAIPPQNPRVYSGSVKMPKNIKERLIKQSKATKDLQIEKKNSYNKPFNSFKHKLEIKLNNIVIYDCNITEKPKNAKDLLFLLKNVIELTESTK